MALLFDIFNNPNKNIKIIATNLNKKFTVLFILISYLQITLFNIVLAFKKQMIKLLESLLPHFLCLLEQQLNCFKVMIVKNL